MRIKLFLISIPVLLFQPVSGQYNFIVNSLITNPNVIKMQPVDGVFNLKINLQNKNAQGDQNARIYAFSNKMVNIKYFQNNRENKCDELQIFGKMFSMKGEFENDLLACNLDVTSFEIFRFTFGRKEYLLIKSIKAGSGEVTTYIIFHLFDITNLKKIEYYPLWSKYGSISCFGDFNHDGKLDFLRIRDNWKETGKNTYKANLETLDTYKLKFISNTPNEFIIFEKTYSINNNLVIKILHKSGF